MSTYTLSETSTFTLTHARHIAAKVATDLKRMQRFYNEPSDSMIGALEEELIKLIRAGYLAKVTYGFQRDRRFIEPTLVYTARELEVEDATDHDPGRVWPGADIIGASFSSYLEHNLAWQLLPEPDKISFEEQLPFQRTGAPEPGINGYLQSDRTYSAGGRALNRARVRAF